MPLPKRDYYFLDEIMTRLPLTLREIQYYICHGNLLTSIWVPLTDFSEHGSYRGYVHVDPDVCFDLFYHGRTEARSFYHFYPFTRLIIPAERTGIPLTESTLMVHGADFETFVGIYDVPLLDQKQSAGRPTIMPEIITEYHRRRKLGKDHKTLAGESEFLYAWATGNFSIKSVPQASSIRNALIREKASA
jgi:hypothetical protein